jgi:hypothetical protein
MADTYDRIRFAVGRLAEKTSWNTTELAEAIQSEKPVEFRFRRGQTDQYMSIPSIRRILRLVVSLDLAEADTNQRNAIKITERGKRSLRSDTQCALQVRACVTTFLDDNGVTLDKVKAIVSELRLPKVPDATTIFEELSKDPTVKLNENSFRTMMYLLAKAGGADRAIKVLYTI